ncbi:unnamed protein product [Protopolystoma xenopodis]|uniref:Uncharacterized protein n=1 Tax=Protopolystoma xenopodis TaxID=117903 RepID=A0A448XG41_9PLAT|nr:unnamed protein product [Protopolystoma xenopodis]
MLIAFLLMTSLWGFYSFPTFRKLCPHPHQTEMACVLANVTCFLLISSSLPLQARLLGLTPFALAPMFFDYHSSTESSTFDAAKTPQSIQLYSIFPKSSLEIPQLVSQRFSSETTLRSKEVGAMEFVTRSVYSNKRKSHLFDNSVPSSSSTLLALHKVSEDDTYKSLSLAEPTINIEDRISALKSSSASNLVNQPFSAIESQSSSDVKVTSLIDPQTSNPLLPIEFDKILLSMFPGAGSSGGGGVYENSYFFLLVYNLAFLCLSLIMTGPQLRLLLAAGQAELAFIDPFSNTLLTFRFVI